MKNFSKLISFGVLVSLMLIISSCEEEVINTTPDITLEHQEELSPVTGELLGLLECLKFETVGALESDEYVTVEGDIVIAKSTLSHLASNDYSTYTSIEDMQALQDELDKDSLMVQQRQYVINHPTLITLSTVDDIEFYIHSSVSSSWRTAIITALSNWSDVSDCKVDFEEVSSNSSADLSFYADDSCPVSCMNNLPNDVAAKAMFPQNNNVGRYISINNVSLTSSQKKWVMRHEIGHALGFRHNNAVALGEPNTSSTCGGIVSGLNLLIGTPANDTYSVMRTPGPLTLSLSSNDKEAAVDMYPDPYTTPTINSHSITLGNPHTVTLYTNSSDVDPYEVVVTRHSTSSSSILQSNSFYSPNNDDTAFTVSCPSGTWRFKVWRKNFGSYSKVSSYRTVTIPW